MNIRSLIIETKHKFDNSMCSWDINVSHYMSQVPCAGVVKGITDPDTRRRSLRREVYSDSKSRITRTSQERCPSVLKSRIIRSNVSRMKVILKEGLDPRSVA